MLTQMCYKLTFCTGVDGHMSRQRARSIEALVADGADVGLSTLEGATVLTKCACAT